MDEFMQAVIDFEVDQDDLLNALYAGAVNAARAFMEDLTDSYRRVVVEGEIAGVTHPAGNLSDALWTGSR